jgi:hypothetical protein
MIPPAASGEHMDERPDKPSPQYKYFIQYYRQDQNPDIDEPYWWYFTSEADALASGWENWHDERGSKYKAIQLYCGNVQIRNLR